MQEHFQKEIDNLKSNLIKMASLVDEQVERAFKALETGDIELCKGIKAKDLEIDAYDNLILTECENILALFQPVASDLRFIMSTLLINNQLERCGDIAVNIAQRVRKTSDHRSVILESEIREMGKHSRQMVKDAIDSFVNQNIELAEKVLETEETVDKLNKSIFKSLIVQMQTDSALVEPGAHLIVLTRHIERLADHATNIAEDLIFYIKAEIIAHKKKLERYNEETK
ncbi:MAG: phosphate transport system regulatory protein PhoU [Ignavibacteriae bacterium HGW-Ignavibacteriae-3]|nr:MAG: phosphate transport system regulatory protein PhoU [Ignavibacteriae bacterium HGW-Ignavibacteriae-3]